MLAQLALENTTYRFDKPFTYSVPRALETAVRPGVRVTVPFGAGNRTRVAMVLSTSYESGAGQKLKAIASVLDKEPLLDDEMLALIPWMKSRCFCTLYDAVKVMIPAGIGYKLVNRYRMNAAFKNYDREAFTDTAWQIIVALTAAKNGLTGAELTERLGIEEKSSDLLSLLENGTVIRENAASRNAADATTRMVCAVPDFSGKLTPKQQSAFDTLCAIGTVTVRELSYYTGVSAGIIRTLADKGAAEIFEVERFRRPKQEMADIKLPQTLSAEQMNVANDILRECDAAEPMVGLLYGVTGENTVITGKLRELNIPYIYIGDYVEESPMGKAEWLVVAAELCDLRQAGADTLRRIARDYEALRSQPAPGGKRPKVMLNTPYRDTWFMPSSHSYMIRLIEDAGGEYVYTGNTSDASVAVDLEEAYLLANASDIWINVGACNTLAELTAQNPKFADIPVVRNRRVYNNNARQTPAGGSDFWESAVVRPDVVLRDLRTILSGGSEPTFYYKRLE